MNEKDLFFLFLVTLCLLMFSWRPSTADQTDTLQFATMQDVCCQQVSSDNTLQP